MTTAGKSDIFEAVVQILVLKSLHERGSAKSERLVKDLQQKAQGIAGMKEDSVYIALRKLENSGWIRKSTASVPRSSVKWELTQAANKSLPLEFRRWKAFMEDWPPILTLLKSDLG